MTRAERRRQAKMQEKCQVPLNLNLTVAQVAGMTGQQASILQTYLKRMEQQKTCSSNIKDLERGLCGQL